MSTERPRLYPSRGIVGALLAAIVLLGFLAWISSTTGTPISDLTRDPLAVADGQVYWGVLSNLGILLWSSSAAVAIFAALVLRRSERDREGSRFLLLAGLLTAYLTLDDLFLFHETVLPQYLSLRERYVLPSYLLLMGGLIWSSRNFIRKTSHLPLLLAGLFFLTSLGVDKMNEGTLPMHHLFEDGAKFLGIVCWSYYLHHTAFRRVTCP